MMVPRNLPIIFYTAIPLLIILLATACKHVSPPEPDRSHLDSLLSIPVSELNIPVSYPVKEIENLINEKLNGKIIESRIPMNQKGDSVLLNITKLNRIKLSYDGNKGLTFKIPLLVDGFFQSKILGVGVKNRTPIRTKLIITIKSTLHLNENWQLKPKSEIKKIEWLEKPTLKVAGIKFNLQPQIEKSITKNENAITKKIDDSVDDLVKFSQSMNKLWSDIQKPIRINKKISRVWLNADAVEMTAHILHQSKDTLTIGVGLFTRMFTMLDSVPSSNLIQLPKFKVRESDGNDINAFLLVTLPFEQLNKILNQATDTIKFKFGNHEVRVKKCEIFGTPDGIAIETKLVGDLRGKIYFTGIPGYDSITQSLVINNFNYDIHSEESIVHAANWMIHDEVIERIQPYLKIAIGKSIDSIPELIFKGIEKGRLGQKIEVNFTKFNINLEHHLVTEKNIQFLLHSTGNAKVQLKKGLFVKKPSV
jgi:hypothetical protein